MCLAVPGQVTAISNAQQALGIVTLSGIEREVNLACVIEPGEDASDCIGQWVLVHAGFALNRLDADEAQMVLTQIAQLDASIDR